MATLLYCDCGACGPDGAGAGGLCCRSSDFFSESRMPLVGGDTGVAGPAGCDCEAGLMIELGLRS